DGRILASGKNPDKDVYELEFKTDLTSVGGLRLEILPHDSLPAKGPGRAGNGNLVVKTIEATLNGQPLAWQASAASHSQDQHKGEYVASGDPNGWAILPQTGKSNQLVLQSKEAVSRPKDATETILKVTIQQHHGGAHTLGHFRFYATSSTEQASPTELANEELAKLAALPVEERKPEQQAQLWNAFREQTPLLAELRETLKTLNDRKTALDNSIVTTLGTESVAPREMRVLPRGNWMDNSGEVVTPQVPHFLPQPNTNAERLNRLDLAKWMVSSDNPLVARTFVNRMWMLCFGQGIARSVDDLGSQGSWPTHPELLDWLAVEFVESGWDIKHLFKLMVMSETYRQTSLAGDELRKADPYNELYARQSRWRLEAEMIRDNALAISGLLVPEVGGVSVKPYQPAGYWDQLNFPKRTYQHDGGSAQYRRGVYTHWQRTFLHPSLLAFDAPAREECTARRERSNTPIQALVLLNDPTYVEAARKFAERILSGDGDTFDAQLDRAYRLSLSRVPETYERELLSDLYHSNLDFYRKEPESAENLLQTGLAPMEDNMDKSELAAWTTIARTILNLHETITRY
ncbi:MAG TPA: DUF1553 domain-containing protein, partial [Planctomycetaceae bacterium]|nr:DUF1553 domain-containing protein [Planctomycetaceae bacterium]